MTAQQIKARSFLMENHFLPITEETYPILQGYDKNDTLLYELTSTITAIWAPNLKALWSILQGYLCTVWFSEEIPVYFEINHPPGPREPHSLQRLMDDLSDLAEKAGLPALVVYAIEEPLLGEYQSIQGYHITTEYTDDHSEYLYRTADFLDQAGHINKEKRYALKKGADKEADLTFCPLSAGNIALCLDIQEAWCRDQDCEVCSAFVGCEKNAIKMMTAIFKDPVHQGLLLSYQGKPAGFSIWERKNEKIAHFYLAKTNLRDVSLYFYYYMVKTYLSNTEYINIGEDMGKRGLRLFKSRLGHYQLYRKYLCIYMKERKDGKQD